MFYLKHSTLMFLFYYKKLRVPNGKMFIWRNEWFLKFQRQSELNPGTFYFAFTLFFILLNSLTIFLTLRVYLHISINI